MGNKIFPLQGVFTLVLIPALHGRPIPVGLHPLSPRLHNVPALLVTALQVQNLSVLQVQTIAAHRCYRCGTFAALAREKMADHPFGFAHLTARQRALS
jgi:hypothetical protein